MRARHGGGHGMGLPLDLIGQLIAPGFMGSGSELKVDGHRCNLCGKCQMICRRHAIYINRKRRIWTLYPNRCNLCLNCANLCPKRALNVVRR